MSKAKTGIFVGLLAILCTPGHAQTIDEITDAARQKKLESFRSTPAAPSAPLNGARPPLPIPLPSTDTPKRRIEGPYLLAIYGIGNRLATEIAEDGSAARYRAGDVTTGGWTVTSIGKREVNLVKRNKRGNVVAVKKLSFWRELDAENASERDTKEFQQTGRMPSIPPYPPAPAARF